MTEIENIRAAKKSLEFILKRWSSDIPNSHIIVGIQKLNVWEKEISCKSYEDLEEDKTQEPVAT